jgi:hypothetical protein
MRGGDEALLPLAQGDIPTRPNGKHGGQGAEKSECQADRQNEDGALQARTIRDPKVFVKKFLPLLHFNVSYVSLIEKLN